MDRKIAIISSIAALVLGACTAEPLQDPQESPAPEVRGEDYVVSKVTGVTYARQAVVPGILKVKFNESFAGRIEECGASVGVLCADTRATPTPFRKFRPLSMHRLFEYAGEYEPRTRAAGLDRWYVLEFDAAVDLAEAELSFHGAEEVEAVEYQLVAKVNAEPFNDPQLPSQWHYHNPGTAAGTVSGLRHQCLPCMAGIRSRSGRRGRGSSRRRHRYKSSRPCGEHLDMSLAPASTGGIS